MIGVHVIWARGEIDCRSISITKFISYDSSTSANEVKNTVLNNYVTSILPKLNKTIEIIHKIRK